MALRNIFLLTVVEKIVDNMNVERKALEFFFSFFLATNNTITPVNANYYVYVVVIDMSMSLKRSIPSSGSDFSASIYR